MILDAFSLQGKVAVVSGCDTGLGQGMALGLAEAGCDIVGINIVEPVETIERVTALGRRFLSLTADLRQIDGIPSCWSVRWRSSAILIFWSITPG
ncbi:2-deoxy-D-gluconate 3-dehydrogenase [Klebsiella aerogenes]|nr:2-deoxy-D-gluconate 3-dehydrogenase [Klebsiella aerogenes]